MSEPLTDEELKTLRENWSPATGSRRLLATIDALQAEIATMRGIREALDEASSEVVALKREHTILNARAARMALVITECPRCLNQLGAWARAILKGEGE